MVAQRKKLHKFDIFYGEYENWVVTVSKARKFQFMYKGDPNDLKNNNTGKINFFYGTALESTGVVQSLNGTSYYQVMFADDFITDLPSNNVFSGNKFVNVQISYAGTTDSIDLVPYIECEAN